MTVLTDKQIEQLGIVELSPEAVSGPRRFSSGFSSFGFDVTLSPDVRLLKGSLNPVSGSVFTVDPKNVDEEDFIKLEVQIEQNETGDLDRYVVIPAGGFALGCTNEYFKLPEDVVAICVGKSTYARVGLILNVTPLEPEWEGQVTLEMHNTTPCPIKVYVREGICQFVFHKSKTRPSVTYKDKSGKYQGQRGVTYAKVV